MSAETLADWLRCPVCTEPLTPAAATILGCVNGHRFDINKRGYATLLGSRSRVAGDTPAMLDARSRVLERGTYAPIVDTLDAALDQLVTTHRVIDAGAGTGYYLRSLLASRPTARGLALDLSSAGVARAVRSADRIDGVVADTWQPLPVRDGIADVILNIFAPRNLPEFYRILAPEGTLVVVVPRPEHLHELREDGRMLDVPADKAATLIESTAPLFAHTGSTAVVFDIVYDAALADSLVAMGPSAHHMQDVGNDSTDTVEPTHSSATVAVDVLTFAPRQAGLNATEV
ncbi:putative RNA methyltransferase [Diaminobutyricibacter sp. McL0618]|uniref:putative RNA methyltransferase n=1 Tax=Leifsonia sp. McL0618 TaxID=3415677 RepID=UPI003CEA3C9A